ncbi:glycine--tRNA ligase subunit beta [Mesobaculum littorinae]|uniref:Glycine--tRNA ligase beta subunit n=1 Tax=Mesobaculum littorinae TaxID=2486419 RepID=A0A438AJC9_9RHOB|nr:glycine--tRNA ligase subunit beta [Mesobaculum littorinae]RVV98754.1 glycine--tRNA ligase subunit beta [Mesobaculum littorinae]
MPDLLIELFSEEIPARMQGRAADDLKRRVTDGLVEAGLTYASAGAFSTPRRLVLSVEGLTAESPAQTEERKGPRVDAPDKAIEGFLRSTGLARQDLETRSEKKGEVYFAVIRRPGRPARDIVAEVLETVVRGFPWPKSMRWGAGEMRWVRPLHRILCLLSDEAGAEIVPLEIDGIRACDVTEGHRFLSPGEFSVSGFEDYAAKLRRAYVVLSPAERAEAIRADADTLAFAAGREVVEDRALLAEVAGLVEWPVVLMGAIGKDYLDLPPEVLQTSMREHQKFFSVRSPGAAGDDVQITHFITVANRETADDGATILAGNGRVLAARLADAKFFWDNDLRVARDGMAPWLEALSQVTFHARLGSVADRSARIARLARRLAPVTGADPDTAAEAARLAKADLTSEMVYEFPELQGVMGRYYAQAARFGPEIADAVRDHYKPLGPSDEVPEGPVTQAVALADKIEMLRAFWAIDEKPTGSKDPFALRRAALGVIRLCLAHGLRLPLLEVLGRNPDEASDLAQTSDRLLTEELASGGAGLPGDPARPSPEIAADLLGFFHDRLKVHLRDAGLRHDVIDACLAMPGSDDLVGLVRRAEALGAVLGTDEGENLLQGFRRANNILAQAEEKDGVEYSFGPDEKFAEADEEKALFAALDRAEAIIAPALSSEDFATAMAAMADLRAPIDAFFEAVQINTDNQIIRRNRLNLLGRIRQVCGGVADLTRIEG